MTAIPGGLELRAIFISYRRHDSEGEAGRLFDDLVAQFGERSVFMDVAAIEVGRDFRKAIDESVDSCGVMLAMIGPAWLEARTEAGERRLDDPNDFVRIETGSALKRDIPVIPVLVRGARMPRADQLPDDLKDLAYRNYVELTHVRWKSDIRVLVRALRPMLPGPSEALAPIDLAPRATDSKVAPREPPSADLPITPAPGSSLPMTPATDISCNGVLDAEAIAGVTRELAHYIGPIAEIVVERTAKRCSTLADLRRMVAQEIDVPADRARFLDACRES